MGTEKPGSAVRTEEKTERLRKFSKNCGLGSRKIYKTCDAVYFTAVRRSRIEKLVSEDTDFSAAAAYFLEGFAGDTETMFRISGGEIAGKDLVRKFALLSDAYGQKYGKNGSGPYMEEIALTLAEMFLEAAAERAALPENAPPLPDGRVSTTGMAGER